MKTIQSFRHIVLLLLFAAGAQWASAQSTQYFTHTVTKGQGLYSIARMYHVTEADIIALNPGSDIVIKAGQTLKIPQKQAPQQQADKPFFHTIKAGETLYRLTVIYQLSAREICEANPGLSAENFKVGQVITIPARPRQVQPVQPVVPQPVVNPENPADDKARKDDDDDDDDDDNLQPGDDRCKLQHKVKRRETIYKISRKYGITELELIQANPSLSDGKVRRGEILCIPYTQAELAQRQRQQQPDNQPAIVTPPSNEDLFSQSEDRTQTYGQIKAAIILPFLLDDDTIMGEQQKMVEYYEGFLIALDSLKHTGVSVDLHVYDSGDRLHSIRPILARPEMRQMNIIFGPMYPNHIEEAAAFADSTHINLVIPFARNVEQVFTNPYIYQINTPQSYFYSEVNEHFFRQFPNPNVLFFEADDEPDDPYVKVFKQELNSRQVPYIELPADTATNQQLIRSHCDPTRQNILMMSSSKSGSLNNMVPVFQLLARDTASTHYDIHMFGYPEYQVYTHNHLASFYEIDTYFYSSFYTNNLLPRAVNFHKLFRRTYSKEIVNRYPKYAILGFDTGLYFLQALHRYGSDMDKHLADMHYDPVQTGFKFERVNNWGGFINRKVFFIHLSNDYTLQKIDFDE